MESIMKKILYPIFIVLIACAALITVSSGGNAGQKTELTVSAAASLKDALTDIEKLYIEDNPGVKLVFNFGGSGSLQRQIEQGAPVDIFISASLKQVSELASKKMIIESSVTTITANDIVLIVPIDSRLSGDFTLLSGSSVKRVALGETKSVPVGQYSLEILDALKIKEAVMAKAVFAKDVREVLTWVETGNADAGIVYKTDALIAKGKVRVIASAPAGTHKPVTYPAAVVSAGKNINMSRSFIAFLQGEKAQNVFLKYGFLPYK